MSTTVSFLVTDSNNQPLPGRGRLYVQNELKERAILESLPGAPGRLSFAIPPGMAPDMLHFRAEALGFWDMAFPTSGSPMQCAALPVQQQGWWWHDALNCHAQGHAAGDGIKIGIIDTDFICRDGLEHVDLIS